MEFSRLRRCFQLLFFCNILHTFVKKVYIEKIVQRLCFDLKCKNGSFVMLIL